MSLRADLQSKKFIITAEINPPKGSHPEQAIANAKKISKLVSAINITDNSGAAMKMCSLVLSYLIQREAGVSAIWQMTCRDRNRLALQSDLLGAAALGLSNILVLRGDAPLEPIKEEKCFDMNTEDLIQAISALKSGKDLDNNPLKEGVPDFCMAAAAHPGVPNLAAQKDTMLKRMDMGVEFFQTQICFEKQQIDKFVESIGEELAAKTILGITPLKTLAQANFMNKNIFGVTVPEAHLNLMGKALGEQDPKSEEAKSAQQKQGLILAKELVSHVKSTPLKGIHVMAIGQEDVLNEIVDFIR